MNGTNIKVINMIHLSVVMISTDKNLPLINSSYTILLNVEQSTAVRLTSSVWQRKSSALRLAVPLSSVSNWTKQCRAVGAIGRYAETQL
jgi:hypothetical protein